MKGTALGGWSSVVHVSAGNPKRFGVEDLIDTPAEPAFDRITSLAAQMLQVPISMVSVLDSRRNFFKSIQGLPEELEGVREVPLSHSYCRFVIARGEMLAIEDTLGHPVVGANPTNSEFGIRAYLGMPVFAADGELACSLCVLDRRPRRWTDAEIQILRDLASILETELSLREEIRVRRAAEEHNSLLLREMEHRVKNSLSTVQALVSLSLKEADGAEDLRTTLLERIASLAQTQSLLLNNDWNGATLDLILRSELAHYGSGASLLIEAGDIRIAARDVVVVGMIIHELTTNAAKYGALSGNGRLHVTCRVRQDEGGRRLLINWREDGLALAGPPKKTGFGSTLLETLIVRQHEGRVEREWTAEGLHLKAELLIQEAD